MDAGDRMVSLQFSWGGERKEVSSIWIGTSPEFELALYTLCFVAGAEVILPFLYNISCPASHLVAELGPTLFASTSCCIYLLILAVAVSSQRSLLACMSLAPHACAASTAEESS